ncbi:MAG TPA: primosomal protein N', partial [Candidatus Limnocylindria bacterium]|nr:primosomal protein N' [Candidatus Limnocylindria bacterium]
MALGTDVVRVAVDAIADRPERTFTYRLPPELRDRAEPGALVLVPYGHRLALGYLLDGAPDALDPGQELRDVEAVVSAPMLTRELLTLAEEIAAYYRAPVGTSVAAMLPPGLESRLDRRWQIAGDGELPDGLAALADGDGLTTDTALMRLAPKRGREQWLERLRRSGAVRARWELRPPDVTARRVRVLRAVPGGPPPRKGAPVQHALLAAVADEERTFPELADALGVDAGSLLAPARRLAAIGAAELEWRDVDRDPLAHRAPSAPPAHDLVDEQRAALGAIEALPPGGELLLEGVAAAGKTDVYLAAIDAALERGEAAIVLVPEVSLIPQLADRLHGLVGDALAVLHSGLSAGERHDEWWRILRGEARVVVGTRTAAFAPLPGPVLLVVDEAHDAGFKSDRTPRYDARWVARRRAQLGGGRAVFGTATPDVVTLARVRGGLVERSVLHERRVGRAPRIELVDLRDELSEGNRSIFSRLLHAALRDLRPGEEQAILLMNRRGASTFILCRDCGESLRCPDCDLPFVYHSADELLRCHHCGRTAPSPERCPHCASPRIRFFGAGTQRVEAELRSTFPHLRVARLDSDALAARRGFESIYDDLRDGRIDVLVGTQLAAKGLDLPTVTLAAVIAADVTLNLPDYLA